jgi:hypothetical protein
MTYLVRKNGMRTQRVLSSTSSSPRGGATPPSVAERAPLSAEGSAATPVAASTTTERESTMTERSAPRVTVLSVTTSRSLMIVGELKR